MIVAGSDTIFSGFVSGMVATTMMTATEIPPWRKWGSAVNSKII